MKTLYTQTVVKAKDCQENRWQQKKGRQNKCEGSSRSSFLTHRVDFGPLSNFASTLVVALVLPGTESLQSFEASQHSELTSWHINTNKHHKIS